MSVTVKRTAATLLAGAMMTALGIAAPHAAQATGRTNDACHTVRNSMPRGDCGPFEQVFTENFNGDRVPVGAFSDCDHAPETRQAVCEGLSGEYRAKWWAYPNSWPDTAKSGADGNGGRKVGGVYHPEDTVSVGPRAGGDGVMKIRMWRPADGGDVHSAALVPRATIEQAYGKFSARIKVVKAAPGYKSAWLHYGDSCEMDYPEQNWNDTITAFHHPCNGGEQGSFATGQRWTEWHTVSTEWTPGLVRFYLDGKLVGQDDRRVPDQPLAWVLQNETALYGADAAPGSSAEMYITWVTAYAYKGDGKFRTQKG